MDRLPAWKEALYGAPYLIKAMALTPLLVFIPSFYSVDYGLPLALVGTILFATRMTDVVTDPLIGIVSDRIQSPGLRRKLFIALGTPLLMLSAWMVFVPPVDVTPLYAVIWLGLIYFGFTLMDIPYKAWGAELVTHYDGRTRLAAWREAAGTASGLFALILIMLAPRFGMESTADTMRLLGLTFLIGLPILITATLVFVPPAKVERIEAEPLDIRKGLRAITANKPFLWLLGGMTVLLSGAIIGASLHLIVMESYFGIRHLFPFILSGEAVAGLISAPFWVWLSRRIGKHRALATGTLLMGLLSAPIPLLSPDQHTAYAAIIIVRGFAGGALAILMASMLADVADFDLNQTGQGRQGLFFALMGMVGKFGAALGVFVGMVLPPLFGFEPSNETNTDTALRALLMTYAWIPMVIMGSSSWFFWRYPLDREAFAELRAEIDAKAR
ncbi:MAG: MFS transporter [Litorimonas sp.]